MKYALPKGSTNVTLNLFILDTTSTVGAGLTGLTYATASLVCWYVRAGGTPTQVTLVTQTATGAHTDGGFCAVSGSNMPGWYRLDLPDACFASGADSVGITLRGATNMAEVPMEIQLNLQETVENEVFDAAKTAHDTAGTFGNLLNDLSESVATNGVALSSTVMNAIADALLQRDVSNVEDTAGLNTLAGLILSRLHWSVSGTTLTIYKTGGTSFSTLTLTTSASAAPITSVT